METTYTAYSLILLIFAEEIKGIKAISFYPVHLKKTKEYSGRWCEVLLPYLGLLKAVWGKRSQGCLYSLWEMEHLYSLEEAGIENPIGTEIWSGGDD